MWPRTVEVMLGIWLAISPFVFRVPDSATAVWAVDFVCAALVVTCSLAAFWPRLERAHLGTLALGLFLAGYGWLHARPLPPAEQNHMIVGLLLFMFALIPSNATEPPRPWRR